MKASELQIGDFVLVDDKPTKIEQITKKKIGYHIEEHECYMHYSRLCEIAPIELSEDFIKENLNFKRNLIGGLHCWEYNINDKYYITINDNSNTNDRDFYIHVGNEDLDSICGCDVQYLHQLQQIVRLATGKEMEVML